MKSESKTKNLHLKVDDRPIESFEDDWLERKPFAEKLAKGVAGLDASKGLVISLEGGWGSGKSSLKYMLLKLLEESEERNFPRVDFSPWQISGQKSLTETLFEELGSVLEDEVSRAAKKKKKKTAKEFQSVFSRYARKILPFSKFAKPAGYVAAALGGEHVDPESIRHIVTGFEAIGTTLEIAEEVEQASESKPQSLEELKKELEVYLSQIKKPVLVVIDDIDRLLNNEIAEIFQLVKSNADFPNVVYLLLFERRVVADALNGFCQGRGHEFLEKIVQISFSVTFPRQAQLENRFQEEFSFLLQADERFEVFEKERWGDAFLAIKAFIRTPRNLNRLLSSLEFQLTAHSNCGKLDANPIDIVLLECLRVFEQNAYEEIVEARVYLTEGESSELARELLRKPGEESPDPFESILTPRDDKGVDRVELVLNELFPKAAAQRRSRIWSKTVYSEEREGMFASKRLCHEKCFDRYFMLQLAGDDVPEWQYHGIRDAFRNGKVLKAILRDLSKAQQRSILQRLDFEIKKSPVVEHDLKLAIALTDFGDECYDGRIAGEYSVQLGRSEHIQRIVSNLVRAKKAGTQRSRFLKSLFEDSEGLWLPSEIVRAEARKDLEDRHKFFKSGLPKGIAAAYRQRVLSAVQSMDLEKMGFFGLVLFAIEDTFKIEEARKIVQSLLERPKGVFVFLDAIKGVATSSSSRKTVVVEYIDPDSLKEYVSIEYVKSCLNKEKKGSLNDSERKVLGLFERMESWDEVGTRPDPSKLLDQEWARHRRAGI